MNNINNNIMLVKRSYHLLSKERTSRNKTPKKYSKHGKKEDFKVKLSTTATYKIKPLFKIRQGSGFLSKTGTKANMANFKKLQSLFY